MSGWFDTKSFTSLAKSALSQAQKQLDKALEAVNDEESASDSSDIDPFDSSGWATRKPKLKKNKQSRTSKEELKAVDEKYGETLPEAKKVDPPPAGESKATTIDASPAAAVTSQVKASPDAIVGPITVQIRSQKTEGDEKDEGPMEENGIPPTEATPLMKISSDSVETTVQSDLDFSMLEETKDDFFRNPSSKSSSPVCRSDSSGGAPCMDIETAASSDIEIISAINSTPSEALNQDQSNLWESDVLSNALRELSGEMPGPTAMETLLHAREQKIMTLSSDNARLVEENEKLRQRVAQLEARNLESCRNSSEQVQQLLTEGDKLAKEVLEKSNMLKKLRAKEKEQNELLKKHTKTIDELNIQLDRLRKSMTQKDAQEKLHIGQIRELKAAKITAADLKCQLDQAKSRCSELESRNAKILMESKVMTASVELSAQDQFRSGIAELKAQHAEEVDHLKQKVLQLESSLKKAELIISQNEQHGNGLRQEVLSLQERNQELTESLSLATAPYVRELDKMKALCDSERKSFENEIVNLQRVVETLRQKLSDLEEKRNAAVSAKDEIEAKCRKLTEEVSSLENLVQEAKRSQAPVKIIDPATLEYIEVLKSQLVEREDAITKMNQAIELLKSKETSLQQKVLTLERSVEFEKQKSRLEALEPRPASPTISTRSSLGSSDFEKNENYSAFAGNVNSPSVLDNMSSQLKLKDGQMLQLRVELSQLKKSRDTLSDQMAEMSLELERYKEQEDELADVTEKYEALLQMYGELVEKSDELKLDLEEARNAYRVQIQDLTTRLRKANA
ncbi:TATA element modulatory factor [Galendromus occidentalis]|uniref:TATA element modulatory factor n=1 Tax=Galendromus occidentalis TaxID=34638 RepID=A0AAJ6QQU7_9ACAR|nr:TATA element modulatory factor [Galendromus occidentalis]